MNRGVTNLARFILDELVPPIIRDNRIFMWPFFAIFCRKWNVDLEMNFKSHVLKMSEDDFVKFYKEKKSFATLRPTDLNGPCIQNILDFFSKNPGSILDVGCGKNGYMVQQMNALLPGDRAAGIDINPPAGPNFHSGFIERLPFADNSFDYVLSTHTLEHILDLTQGVSELFRVAKHGIVVVVPKQRYYYYTVDEHIIFFPSEDTVQKLFYPRPAKIMNLGGDWLAVVQK